MYWFWDSNSLLLKKKVSFICLIVTTLIVLSLNLNIGFDFFILAARPKVLYYILLSILIILSIFTFFKDSNITDILVVVILFTGSLLLFIASNSYSLGGAEILFYYSIILSINFEIIKKNKRIKYYPLILLIIIMKLIISIYFNYFNMTGVIVYSFFFFITGLLIIEQNCKSNKLYIDEINLLLNKIQDDESYNEIGKKAYVDLMHDNYTSSCIVGLDVANEHLDRGNIDLAKKAIKRVMFALEDIEETYTQVREEIIDKRNPVAKIFTLSELFDNYRYEEVNINTEVDMYNTCVLIPKRDFYGIIDPIINNAKSVAKSFFGINIYIHENLLILEIVNDGPPIDWTSRDGIVDTNSFYPGRTTKVKGTGWGVYSSIKKLEKNNGKMKILSDENKTIFSMSFLLYRGNNEVNKK